MALLVYPASSSTLPKIPLEYMSPVPDGYIYKNCMFDPIDSIPIVETQGPTRYLTKDLKIAEVYGRKIYLPRADICTRVDGVSIDQIEENYKGCQDKIKDLRLKWLNKLRRGQGEGIYFCYCFYIQNIDSIYSKSSVAVIENFAAVWAPKVVSSVSDSLFTIHIGDNI